MNIVRYSYPSYRRFASLPSGYSRSPWTALETEIDRLFTASTPATAGVGFPVDLYEDTHNAYVRAELPGVNRDDIQVEMIEGTLTITAVRKTPSPSAGQAPSIGTGEAPSTGTPPAESQSPSTGSGQSEQSATFIRSVTIPAEVSAEQVSAAYENGILTVTLPKREEAKPKKITVSVK